MSSKTDTAADHFDLLPFIAILMCVLGCLLLVTMSIAAISIGPGLGEGWIPGGDDHASSGGDDHASSKIPVLIEWDGKIAVAHRDGIRRELAWAPQEPSTSWDGSDAKVAGDQASTRAAFDAFVDEMARMRKTHYALFAVRPSGFNNFELLADEFRDKGITVGSEPIDQHKPVRLLPPRAKK
jgi:hypothetical protein